MCTKPITIKRNIPLVGTKVYTVPCGKCPECVSKKRSELAALSVHQAHVSGDVRFFTLTYNNDTCPIAIFDPSEDRVVGFERGCVSWLDNGVFDNHVKTDCKTDLCYTPSLCREDVKKWLKQFRTNWFRLKGEKPKFKYCIFGEYGDMRGRPHFHGLFYGVSREQLEMLRLLWSERYGFAYIAPSIDRSVSSEDIAKISNYVSKYISKGVNQRFAHILPYVEKPRRQSSIDFGQFSEDELRKYSSFMMDAIWSEQTLAQHLDVLRLKLYLGSLIGANFSRLMVSVMPCPNR